MAKIIVGISGGVDSALSAYLLKKQGHQVIGIFMRNWDSWTNNDILGNPTLDDENCSAEKDYEDAKKVANQLGIELIRVDFVKEYYDLVFQDLIDKYSQGKTPNPDILCNKYIKFGHLINWIEKNIPDYDFIATGHYAKVENSLLYKPLDYHKDQTYFLAQLTKKQLSKVIFPLENLNKIEVRKIAQEINLVVAQKKDSTGICFIGERKFTNFLKNYIPSQPGDIFDIKQNKVVGQHVGCMYYTIGQRKGLNLGGQTNPYYVVGKNLAKKIIYVDNDPEGEYLNSNKALISNINWTYEKFVNINITMKFRYKSSEISGKIEWIDENNAMVIYPQGFSSVSPGQQCVFYLENRCLGGGEIEKVFLNDQEKTYLGI